MTCNEAINRYMILDKHEAVPFAVTFHLLRCKKCRSLVRALTQASNLYTSSFQTKADDALTEKTMVKIQAEANVPTEYGKFKIIAFSEKEQDWMPHLALIAENTDLSSVVNVRFHSECITGEVFHSKKCECGQQLSSAMQYIQKLGGVIVYLRQEGRNIGIINKLKAYALQEKGLDTVEANLKLGLPADDRNFSVAVDILEILGIKEINLITNNPDKISFVENSKIKLHSRIPLEIKPNEENRDYLKTKKDFFGHFISGE